MTHEPEVCFTARDMALFAAASGDRSPLHTDPAFARRTAFGQCIVYGGLETLAMLGALPRAARGQIRSVSSSFPAPVIPGERLTAAVRAHPTRAVEYEVRLSGRGRMLARLVAAASTRPRQGPAPAGGSEIAGEYRVGAQARDLVERFGLQELDPAILEGVLWASNVVGTTIPEFDGLCAAVTVALPDATAAGPAVGHRVLVRDYDERTDRVLLEGELLDSASRERCLGRIECLPFGPTPLSSAVVPASGEEPGPVGGTAVVVGASRGLGAALALALLERGYAVHGLYERSAEAAAEVARLAGPHAERLTLRQLDAGDEPAMARFARELDGEVDGIALCAAPAALPAGLGAEVPAYVAASLAMATAPLGALIPRLRGGRGWVLACSAPAAAEPSREQPQLGTAKAALEALARWVALSNPNTRVIAARPAKMRTDLANTPAARAAAVAPSAVAAELVRRLHDEDAPAGFEILEVGMEVAPL
jgi:NAD(P)-dependent dehydrogenase (short-subunit alcohol dehydrogenase family)/acyl dehydratase